MASYNTMARLQPQQRQALEGLRRARAPIGMQGFQNMQVDDAAENMLRDNDQQQRNTLTMLATPSARRQHLNMNPAGDVYYPTPGTMQQAGHEMVYGDTSGSGRMAPSGIGQLIDTGWAGFGAHFADKDRMRKSLPGMLAGLRGGGRGGY